MRIACPSCATAYEVPDDRLRPHRMVRCARCGGEWMPVREPAALPEPATVESADEAPPPAAIVEAEPEAPSVRVSPAIERLTGPVPERRQAGVGLAFAWLLSLAVLAGAAGAVFTWRGDIERAWPPSARILR